MADAKWRKSSYSGNGGADCVELAKLTRGVGARDSKDPEGLHHTFSVAAMSALFADIRCGRYDLP
ncbi:DUF397 domain-containing protein [Actinomadura sp. 9N215]|uniref:DUF397 domain-containing protein n=1 Tax=Actinomadura sp. 9N215 TaxID=3375150 RepID=UPI0037983D5C